MSDSIPRHFLEPFSVVAVRPVLVVNVDADLLANGAPDIELHRPGVPNQVRGHVDLDAVLSQDAVRRQVLALEMHVDRHVIFRAASTDGRYEVDRCDTTTLLDQGYRSGSDIQVHEVLSAIVIDSMSQHDA